MSNVNPEMTAKEAKQWEAAAELRTRALEAEAHRLMATPAGLQELLQNWGLDKETIIALAALQDDATVFSASEFVGVFADFAMDIAGQIVLPVESFFDDAGSVIH